MSVTVNQALLEAEISHLVDLRRYSDTVVYRLIAILNRADSAIANELLTKLAGIDPSTFSMDRLESMLYSVRSINQEAFNQVGRELSNELRDFTSYEAAYRQSVMTELLPVQINVASVDVGSTYAGAMARPFQGGLLKGFLADIEAKKARLIRQSVADGFVQGKTVSQIVKEIRGTKAKGYSDGLIEITRRDAQAVVKTAISHTAGFARDAFYEANDDLIEALLWVSTIDLRTSTPCKIRDHLKYSKDHKPVGHKIPWGAGPGRLHWNCRSCSTAIVKSWEELGIPGVPEFKNDARSSMDGEVPASMDYPQWLAKQSAARQDEALGPVRGKLMREGKLSLADMYSAKGAPLTLDQMREDHAAAFWKAGL